MSERVPGVLRTPELCDGPDILRPGTKNGHLGRGEWAFITTRYSAPADQGDEAGEQRLFKYPAARGHESFFTEEGILQAMFGPALPDTRKELLFTHDEYVEVRDEYGATRYEPSGRKKESWDWIELRRRAEVHNLFGRCGSIRGLRVLMLWSQPAEWLDLLKITVAELNVPLDAILTAGRSELGLVKEFLGDAE